MRDKKPTDLERAMQPQEPTVQERAIEPEDTVRRERAIREEKPVVGERAIPREESDEEERAEPSEQSEVNERAVSAEEPAVKERIVPLNLTLGRMFQSVQRLRVGLELCLHHHQSVAPRAALILKQLSDAEDGMVQMLHDECKRSPVWPWLSAIKGIGPRLGGMLFALIDVHKAPTVSSLWKFAGLAVVDGQSDRRKAGMKLAYCDALKKTCYLIGDQFIKQNTQPYRQVYDESKEFYTRTKPDWTKGHCHNAARRRMTKLFLSHLWTEWRRAEGLPVSDPYVAAYLGHKVQGA